MPWRECCKMDERLRFVARLLEGEKMAVLCREFDISRKTGYKIFRRYKDCGLQGLTDRSRRPYRHANRLAFQIETLIVELKKEGLSILLSEQNIHFAELVSDRVYVLEKGQLQWQGAMSDLVHDVAAQRSLLSV